MSTMVPLSKKLKVRVTRGSSVIAEQTFEHYPITFGRSKKASLTLDFDFVSRNHGVITEENGKLYIVDLKSSNGISLGGKKFAKAEIREGIEIEIGDLKIQISVLAKQETTDVTVDTLKKSNGTATVGVSDEERLKFSKSKMQAPSFSGSAPSFSNKEKVQSAAAKMPPRPASSLRTNTTPLPNGMESHASAFHEGSRKPVLDIDFTDELLNSHPEAEMARHRRIEAIVTWHDQIYDVREFWPGENIAAGPVGSTRLGIPTLSHRLELGHFDGRVFEAIIPNNTDCVLEKDGHQHELNQLIKQHLAKPVESGYHVSCHSNDVVRIKLGDHVRLHLRYIPATAPIPGAQLLEADENLRSSVTTSLVLHGAMALMLIVKAPKDEGPVIKNVPQRYAKLLVEKPKPKPTPPAPKPTPPPKEVAKKEPPKEKIVKVQQKNIKIPKVIAKTNKYPMDVKNPVPKAPPPTKLENLGALAALGAISKSAPANVVTNININPNAGGMQTKTVNTGGIVGAIPTSTGKLVAAGGGPIKTKGFGYGSGTGYGIQGLKGTAGGRGVAGAILGRPQLAKATRPGEGLSRDQVMAVVKQHLAEIQQCYERNLISTPSLKGRMEFEWDIEASGSVSSVRVKRSTVEGGDNLGECVKGIFSGMQFPRAKNGQGTTPSIGFPFGTL